MIKKKISKMLLEKKDLIKEKPSNASRKKIFSSWIKPGIEANRINLIKNYNPDALKIMRDIARERRISVHNLDTIKEITEKHKLHSSDPKIIDILLKNKWSMDKIVNHMYEWVNMNNVDVYKVLKKKGVTVQEITKSYRKYSPNTVGTGFREALEEAGFSGQEILDGFKKANFVETSVRYFKDSDVRIVGEKLSRSGKYPYLSEVAKELKQKRYSFGDIKLFLDSKSVHPSAQIKIFKEIGKK